MSLENNNDDRAKIPNLIRIGAIQSDMNMEIDTDVLDPVVFNNTFCRFVLNNKGFLHSFSKIVLGVNDTASNKAFPAGVGIHSLIERCALKIGTKTIAEIDDFAHWMQYKSLFIDTDINNERETFLTNRVMSHEFNYETGSTTATNSDVNASNYYLKGQRYPNITPEQIYNGYGGGNVEIATVNELKNTPLYSISLSDLFPFLRFNQLPLYMIDQQVSIELHFTPDAQQRVMSRTGPAGGNTINEPEIRFIADYIFYDGEIMNQYREANPTMTWNYVDYRLNKRTISASQLGANADAASKIIMDIGGAGRICSKIVAGLYNDNLIGTGGSAGDKKPDISLLNIYSAKSPLTVSGNNQLFTTNLRYNDHYLYPLDRENFAIHFNDVIQGEGNVPHITRQEYSAEGTGGLSGAVADGGITYNNQVVSATDIGLNGGFFNQVYRLNRNERINSRGLELEVQYSSNAASGMKDASHTHRAWLEILRSATLTDGKFDVDFA